MIGLAYVELLRAVNIRAASDDTSAESGTLPQLVSYHDWKRQFSSLEWPILSSTEIGSTSLRYCMPFPRKTFH